MPSKKPEQPFFAATAPQTKTTALKKEGHKKQGKRPGKQHGKQQGKQQERMRVKEIFIDRLYEGGGLFLIFISLFFLIALSTFSPQDPSFNHAKPYLDVVNGGGLVGAYLADSLLTFFGAASYALPLVFIFWALNLLVHRPVRHLTLRIPIMLLILLTISALFALATPFSSWPQGLETGNGGLVGAVVGRSLLTWLGAFGAFFLPSLLTLLSLLWLTNLSVHDLYRFSKVCQMHLVNAVRLCIRTLQEWRHREKQMEFGLNVPTPPKRKLKPKVERTTAEFKPTEREEEERQTDLPLNLKDGYQLPALHMLDKLSGDVKQEDENALTQNARLIEANLAHFNVIGQVVKICPGPVITIYEFEPAAGVKTAQVVGLADDLARSMAATSIRIAPIPGKNVIGIEMPNMERRTVTLRELLATEAFETHPGKLTVAIGVDTSGQPVYTDIAKMPHALIAGTTGSGKSVAMNAFILSLLYRLSPEQLRFVMIDPKMLELSIYNDIPHLLTPVVTDPNKAATALKWAVKEMERRYKLMSEMGVKNLQSFNAKFKELSEKGEIPMRPVQTGFDPNTGQPIMEEQPLATEPLPFIVVVIDELADLMMVAGKEVEASIARLAQMARAAGLHLLVATQRPSVDVVTGLIKANIPTRFSFNVTSRIDSRTVLDQMGAEQLLGKGDMLFMGNGATNLQRLHGAFVSEEECIKIAEHLKTQGEPAYIASITKAQSQAGGSAGGTSGEEDDPLYRQAIDLVAREQKASTSFIQRHLQIGYNRAARIIEQMEADGLVGAANHVGKREVIVRKPA